MKRKQATRLVVGCFLVAGCSVPGHYGVKALDGFPEASFTYPGSSHITRTHTDGTTKLILRRGDPAAVRLSATTRNSPTQVADFYVHKLAQNGWVQILNDPRNMDNPDRTKQVIVWSKAKLSFEFDVWVDRNGSVTHYDTQLSGTL